MRKKATEIVVGVVLLSPGRGREQAQPTRGSATYSHFTEPHRGLQNMERISSSQDWTVFFLTTTLSFSPHRWNIFSTRRESHNSLMLCYQHITTVLYTSRSRGMSTKCTKNRHGVCHE